MRTSLLNSLCDQVRGYTHASSSAGAIGVQSWSRPMIVVFLIFIAYATTTTTHTHTPPLPASRVAAGWTPPACRPWPMWPGRGERAAKGGWKAPRARPPAVAHLRWKDGQLKNLHWFHRVGDGCRPKYIAQAGGGKEGRRSGRPASSGVPAPERREDRKKRWLHNPRASPARRSERSGRRKVGRLVEGRKERTRSRGRRRGKRGASSLGPRAPRKLQSAPRRRESPTLAGHGARRVGLFWRGGWVGWGGWVGCGG